MIAQKARDIAPFYAMEILEEAQILERQGIDIFHLEIGEPDFDTPEAVKKSAKEAIDKGFTHYTHSLGVAHLREGISDFYKRRYNVDVAPERILISNGTSPCLFLAFAGILELGDEVVLSNPSYPCYKNIISFIGGKLNYVNVNEDENFEFPIDQLKKKINKRTKAILINSPSNPTGTILSRKNLEEIVSLGKLIVSDEIYHGLTYEGEEHSILEFTDNAIVLNGFSKLYAMTGWRLGYVICPEELIRPLQKIQQNFFISANAFVQEAGIAALKNAEQDVGKMRDTYNKRRLVMIERLRNMGFEIKSHPNGAFYVFLNVRKYTDNSLEFAKRILHESHVGVTPGIDFGTNGEGFLRFSYAYSIENINNAMDRLEKFFDKL